MNNKDFFNNIDNQHNPAPQEPLGVPIHKSKQHWTKKFLLETSVQRVFWLGMVGICLEYQPIEEIRPSIFWGGRGGDKIEEELKRKQDAQAAHDSKVAHEVKTVEVAHEEDKAVKVAIANAEAQAYQKCLSDKEQLEIVAVNDCFSSPNATSAICNAIIARVQSHKCPAPPTRSAETEQVLAERNGSKRG